MPRALLSTLQRHCAMKARHFPRIVQSMQVSWRKSKREAETCSHHKQKLTFSHRTQVRIMSSLQTRDDGNRGNCKPLRLASHTNAERIEKVRKLSTLQPLQRLNFRHTKRSNGLLQLFPSTGRSLLRSSLTALHRGAITYSESQPDGHLLSRAKAFPEQRPYLSSRNVDSR